MADKIVQLKDKNSNNLYPISGSSLAESVSTGAIVDGAVTTAKIADGAVTADKIGYATYTLTTGVSLSSNNSYAIRYGKIGLLFLSCRTSSNIASETQVTLYTSDMALENSVSVSVPKVGVQSTLTVTITTDGRVAAYSHSNSYGNWIRAVIPFVADV